MSTDLSKVKLALVAKYEQLAKVASSKVKKKKFLHMAGVYRRQAEELSRQ